MATRHKVAATTDVPVGKGKLVSAAGQELALLNVDGTFFATESKCPHRGGPLENGFLRGEQLTCILHGWEFDLRTGKSSNIPGVTIRTFPVTVEGTDVYVTV